MGGEGKQHPGTLYNLYTFKHPPISAGPSKRNHQAAKDLLDCQMTPKGTINLRSGCKNAENTASKSQQTDQNLKS